MHNTFEIYRLGTFFEVRVNSETISKTRTEKQAQELIKELKEIYNPKPQRKSWRF